MDRYGLTGSNLSHSFSAAFFSGKFRREGIDAAYSNYELKSADEILQLINHVENLRGLNVTIPFKVDVIPLMNELHSSASETGAVNTIKIISSPSGKVLKGFNTDSLAFEETLRPLLKEHHRKALIMGTGGAALAVKAALNRLNLPYTIVSRSAKNNAIPYHSIYEEMMLQHQIIINCTPSGMWPHVVEMPELPVQFIKPLHLVYDLIYNPAETLLLKRAGEAGAVTKNGLDMLHRQAELAWEIWHNDAL